MTLLPVEPVRVSIPDQDWEVDEHSFGCCNPDCDRQGTQTHHVVRRSETGGPKRWVAVDGVVLLNEVRVCLWCHQEINDHNAWIRYLTGEGWAWYRAAPRGQAAVSGDYIAHPKSGRVFQFSGPLSVARP